MVPPKILIVEDERLIARDISDILQSSGYEVVGIVAHGQEAIEKVGRLQPDLVLLDINILGPMDGIEVAEYLHRYCATPVVFLTANSDTPTLERAKKSYPYGFLIKPFRKQQLLSSVTVALETHRLENARLANLRKNIIHALPHEMNTALNNILGFSGLITSEFEELESHEILEYCQDIYTASQRLHYFVRRYLLYVDLEVLLVNPDRFGILEQMEPVIHIDDSLQHLACELAKPYDREGDMVFNIVNHSLRIPLTYFDQLVSELLDNALRYSTPGTPISIASFLADDLLHLTIKNRSEDFRLDSLSDAGAYVLSKSIFHDRQGSGLGMAIVQQIVKLTDSCLDIHYGEDSIVTITVKFKTRPYPLG